MVIQVHAGCRSVERRVSGYHTDCLWGERTRSRSAVFIALWPLMKALKAFTNGAKLFFETDAAGVKCPNLH